MPDGVAPAFKATGLEPCGHARHRVIKPAPGQQGHQQRQFDNPAITDIQRQPNHTDAERCRQADHDQNHNRTTNGTVHFRAFVAIKFIVEKTDQRTDDGDGVFDPAKDKRRFADIAFDGQRQQQQDQRIKARFGAGQTKGYHDPS